MTSTARPNRYGQPAPAGGHHHPHQEAPTMNSTPTPAQRLAAAYGRTETPQDERRRADAAANYRPGQAEELTAAADRFPGRGTLRLQAAYAQAAKAAHDELGKQ